MAARNSAPRSVGRSTHMQGNPVAATAGVDLPSYIRDRDEQALAAGLTLERRKQSGISLSTWYRGTEKQWRATQFCHRTAPFVVSMNSVMERGFTCFGFLPRIYAWGDVDIRVRRISDLEFRGAITEDLPEWIEDLGGGITAYGIAAASGVVVYVGDLEEMIARNIAPELARSPWDETRRLEINGVPFGRAWDVIELPGGRHAFCDNVGMRERYNRERAAGDKTDAATPDEWLGKYERGASIWMGMLAKQFDTVRAPNGNTFVMTKKSREAIHDSVNELLDVIRAARVIVKEPRSAQPPGGALQMQRARTDSAFQIFMAQSGLGGSAQS